MPPETPVRREDTLVLPNGTFLYLMAGDSGKVNVYVGPFFQQGLKASDVPVVWDRQKRAFVEHPSLRDAIQSFAYVPDGSYAIVTNPTKSGVELTPPVSRISAPVELRDGMKSVCRGPLSFPLWPQQEVEVIEGHRLKPNNYLVLTVINEEEARKNWSLAVLVSQPAAPKSGSLESPSPNQPESREPSVVPAGEVGGQGTKPSPQQKSSEADGTPTTDGRTPSGVKPEDLVMGRTFILKGTDASFFIPPTGIEVMRDPQSNQYVRVAETLGSMEYCILLDVNGRERYVRGPATVFPLPTEEFVIKGGSRKFRAIELNQNMGIHVKVIEDFVDDDGVNRQVGDEIFITGESQAIFWPRREIVVVKYGSDDSEFMHFAVAIPEGEGRYVLDKQSGKVALERGPQMLLLEPMEFVFVQRALPASLVELLYPGNKDAIEVNRQLTEIAGARPSSQPILTDEVRQSMQLGMTAGGLRSLSAIASPESPGSTVTRRQTFTPPRSVRLDIEKYSGAIGINVHNQYAILVANSSGDQRVEVGPTRVLLEYDETVMPVTLSTGTPKSDDKPIHTAYLRIRNNRISDWVEATTKDLCNVTIRVSYRVDFVSPDDEGRLKWFAVENPIQFLVDHLRSVLRNLVRDRGIQEFYATATNVIRDGILGVAAQGQKRPGKLLAENGMHVTDVEVLSVKITDTGLGDLLTKAQQGSVERAVKQLGDQQTLDAAIEAEERQRALANAKAVTVIANYDLEMRKAEKASELEAARTRSETENRLEEIDLDNEVETRRLAGEAAAEKARLEAKRAAQELENQVIQLRIESKTAEMNLSHAAAELTTDEIIRRMEAEDKSLAERMRAITPNLIAVMTQTSDRVLMSTLTESLAPLAIVGGASVAEVATKFFRGTPLEGVLKTLGSRVADGHLVSSQDA